MNYLKSFFLCTVFLLLLLACKREKTNPSEIITEESIPESFFNFYNRFHSDSLYQLQHISFPIPEIEEGLKYTKENWIINKAFAVDDKEYKREIQNRFGIISEVIYHTQGALIIERRFAKLSDEEWSLIYYKVTTQLDESWKSEQQ